VQVDIHERTCLLIDKSLSAELSLQEQESLHAHMLSCARCQQYQAGNSRVVAALDGFTFELPLDLNANVHRSMQQLLHKMEKDHAARRSMLWTAFSAFLLSFLGSSVVWQLSDYLAVYAHMSAGELQTILLLVWIMPSLLISFLFPLIPGLLMVRRTQKGWRS
jgi:hypothetical protein